MWDELRGELRWSDRQITPLAGALSPRVLEKCALNPPNDHELSALAAMLHSFYNGIENIFKRIALQLGDRSPGSESWHRELLDRMAEATGNRDGVLSPLCVVG